MNYMDLVKASKGKGKMPSMEKVRWNNDEKTRAEKGLCVQCGQNPSGANCFLCEVCETLQSHEEILEEIAILRKKILTGGGVE